MAVMIKNTTPVYFQTDVDYLIQRLIFFAKDIVNKYGWRESCFIMTPKFQELAGIWPKNLRTNQYGQV
ncbi:hypothetical protein P9695_15590 [Weizmannia sp. CD-2023]|uniref:hypothetical protein n=1 Tax=Heyndrickxia TaxID=2837504 RepID=UPI0014591FBD|nr:MULTISPECIES: hypothetical protein [Heyndrickxia]MED4841695.1 hypothetical protein [Weizmannia sp. CD-2023]MED4901028.1 hypothetical protein [Weizmannia sp. CD-2023]NMH83118.1 hypothetical protein [Heyndrickxia coagulans]